MAVQNQGNVFGVIHVGEEFNLPMGQLVVKQLNNGLEMLNDQQFGDVFNILRTLPPHDNIAPYTGYCCYEEPNGQQVRLIFCRRQGICLNGAPRKIR
uniref:Uncharacterized protein n=1 Tax=Leersia perrieri TaxID=77586 RepID=A0A0D9XQF8_9ORYZ